MEDNFSWLLMQQAELMALNAEMQGMIALNQYRMARDETIAYDEKSFVDIAEQMRSVAQIIAKYRWD